MAPEREAAKAQRQASPEGGRHRPVGVLCVPAPVHRVALATGPGAPGPHDAIPGDLLGYFGDRLVVAQGVEVVLAETTLSLGINTRQGSGFTKSATKSPTPISSNPASFSWCHSTALGS